jgi:hypothetical protein
VSPSSSSNLNPAFVQSLLVERVTETSTLDKSLQNRRSGDSYSSPSLLLSSSEDSWSLIRSYSILSLVFG